MVEELPPVEEPQSTVKNDNADAMEPMDTKQDGDVDVPCKENGVDSAGATDEPMNTDKDGKAAEKEVQVWFWI